jgi:hypothetical protein
MRKGNTCKRVQVPVERRIRIDVQAPAIFTEERKADTARTDNFDIAQNAGMLHLSQIHCVNLPVVRIKESNMENLLVRIVVTCE